MSHGAVEVVDGECRVSRAIDIPDLEEVLDAEWAGWRHQ